MSKPVRISDYLAAELQKIADQENRSLANLVQHLLTQALAMDDEPKTKTEHHDFGGDIQTTTTLRHERIAADRHFKPDFK